MKCLILAILLLRQKKKEVNCFVVEAKSLQNTKVDANKSVIVMKEDYFNFIEQFLNLTMENHATEVSEKNNSENSIIQRMSANYGHGNKINLTDNDLKNDPWLPFGSIHRKPTPSSNILGVSRSINLNSLSIDRSSSVPLPVQEISDLVQEMYRNIVYELPALIDGSRDVIVKDIAGLNMLGYTIPASNFIHAAFSTLADLLNREWFIFEAIFDVEFLSMTLFVWSYDWFYSGTKLFPVIFGPGDPNLSCSSQQFFNVLHSNHLDFHISSATDRSNEEVLVLTENVRRDLRLGLGCILSKDSTGVQYKLEEMLSLISLHKKLGSTKTRYVNLTVLEHESSVLWNELPSLVVEAHHAVTLKRYEKNVIFIIIGIWSILGDIGGVLVVTMFTGKFSNPLGLVEVVRAIAIISQGYSNWSNYWLSLQDNDPGCGLADFQRVTDRYQDLRSSSDLWSASEAHPLMASHYVSNWQREVQTALHCLVSQKEGSYLSDTINMWIVLANQRFTNPNTQSINRSSSLLAQDNSELVEEMYRKLVYELPALIDRSRDVIVKDIASKNMLGYTKAAGLFISAVLSTFPLADLLNGEFYFFEAIFDVELLSKALLKWGYTWAFSGPNLFPVIFGSGDPNLSCSSQQFLYILKSNDLDFHLYSAADRPYEEVLVLTENVRRDLRFDLGCILSKTSDYKEAADVQYNLEEMLSLISLHNKLGRTKTRYTDLTVLNYELSVLWNELPSLVVEAHHTVTQKRYEKNVLVIIFGIWSILGTMGGVLVFLFPKLVLLMTSIPVDLLTSIPASIVTLFTTGQFTNPGLVEEFRVFASVSVGYSILLFIWIGLEDNDPGCGLADFQLVTDRYRLPFTVSSLRRKEATCPTQSTCGLY